MKKIYFLLVILVLTSCTSEVEIKDAQSSDVIAKETYIRTTNVEIESNKTIAPPSIKILSPRDNQMIKNSTINVKVYADNFKIVPVGSMVKNREGHFHVWLDSERRISAYNNFTFENVSSGRHSIAAELVMSDHSSLNPRVIKTILINVESDAISKEILQQPGLEEFSIESDDFGFYPNNLMARINDTVIINFRFRNATMYFAGIDIQGPFPTVKYRHGDKQPIRAEFVMKEDVKITSYWPSTGVKKADLMVNAAK
ncbi:MAG TPA: hypothetical protein VJJ52_03310 [Candidatus Nanoarchaeia archaeon]|nr:hypothetical protein [Candidatus Nanoarchaeia archaeon]